MNPYRNLVTASRELARLAREHGADPMAALRLTDAALDAEAQLARDENDQGNLREALEELLAKAPDVRCNCCGGLKFAETIAAVQRKHESAKRHLRKVLERLGGPRVSLDREAQVLREAEEFYGGKP